MSYFDNRIATWHNCPNGNSFGCYSGELGCWKCRTVEIWQPVAGHVIEWDDGKAEARRPLGMNLDRWNFEMLHETDTQAIQGEHKHDSHLLVRTRKR